MATVHASQDLEAFEVAGMALLKLSKDDALYNSWLIQSQHQILWEEGQGTIPHSHHIQGGLGVTTITSAQAMAV